MHGIQRVDLDHEAKLADETGSAQETQRILIEPLNRIADCTDDALVQIGLPPEGVDQLTGKHVDGHGVDGEIAPGQVADQVGAKVDLGMARLVRVMLGAVGRDFDRNRFVVAFDPKDEPDGAELLPDIVDGGRADGRSEGFQLFRSRVRGEIEIVDLEAEQRIPNDAANQRELVSGIGKCRGQPFDHMGMSRLKHDRRGRLTLRGKRHCSRSSGQSRQHRQPSPVTSGQSTASREWSSVQGPMSSAKQQGPGVEHWTLDSGHRTRVRLPALLCLSPSRRCGGFRGWFPEKRWRRRS